MIVSASRRTDIPACYSDWFFNRIKAGFVWIRNPMNPHQISRISLTPDVVDGIVFWTKNPTPMLNRLGELKAYPYYFQFTLTAYGHDIEPNLPPKDTELLGAFQRLSDAIGPDRVIWRYDPILIGERYSYERHLQAFEKIAKSLQNHTRRVTISFIDTDYHNVKANIKTLALKNFSTQDKVAMGAMLCEIARGYGLAMDACAEMLDLRPDGIERARCVDGQLFEKMLGCPLDVVKDKTQRAQCLCDQSIDIGEYNTCTNACRYCYANYNSGIVHANHLKHNPQTPLLSGDVMEGDKVSSRAVKSFREGQMRLRDI